MCVLVQNSRELRGYGSGERRIALQGDKQSAVFDHQITTWGARIFTLNILYMAMQFWLLWFLLQMIDGLDGLTVEKQVHQDFYNGETSVADHSRKYDFKSSFLESSTKRDFHLQLFPFLF
jgi:hypothetical protein